MTTTAAEPDRQQRLATLLWRFNRTALLVERSRNGSRSAGVDMIRAAQQPAEALAEVVEEQEEPA